MRLRGVFGQFFIAYLYTPTTYAGDTRKDERGKIGFDEYGPHGPQNPPGNCDYRRFIDGLVKEFPATCFFMAWNGKWSLATNENTKELLSHPRVANREDLPASLFTPAQ